LAKRWDCSEKAVLRAEKRLGLHPYRFLRAIKYRLSDVLRVEREALQKMPKNSPDSDPIRKPSCAGAIPLEPWILNIPMTNCLKSLCLQISSSPNSG
jgi:hypothetical protein